jgi:uncharacterized protein (DUF1015 family)
MILPARDKAHLVASRSYLTYGKAELRDKLERNPYSYLHVINPDGQQKIDAKRGTRPFYKWVKKGFDAFQDRGWIEAINSETLAVYRQTSDDHVCTGLVGLMDLAEVESGRLKLHEQTLRSREKLFATYLEEVGCNAEPILCAYPEDNMAASQIAAHLAMITAQRPDLDFSTTDRVRHTVWLLDTKQARLISKAADEIPVMYLADGHHRVASSLELAMQHPETNQQGLMSFAIPESELIIRGYHREMRKLSMTKGDWETLFQSLDAEIICSPLEASASGPAAFGTIHLHTSHGSWKWELRKPNIQDVDAGWLYRQVLEPYFQVADARKDARLHYLAGTESSEALMQRAKKYADRCIFELHPVTMEQLKLIADAGGTLPPKSTWIEPKLRTGLFIHGF